MVFSSESPVKQERSRVAAVATLALALSLNTGSAASEALWTTYMEAGQKLYKENKFTAAEKQLDMALENIADIPPDSSSLAQLYDIAGQAYCKTGKMSKSEEVLKKALAIREKNPKKDDLKLFSTLMFLGTVYRNQNKFVDSEKLYKRGLAMFEGKGPIKSVCQCMNLTALGSLYLEMDRPAEAETLLRKAIDLRDKSMLKNTFSANVIHDTLGRSLTAQGRSEEAIKSHELAIKLATDAKDVTGRAFAQGNMATAYSSQGQYDKAHELLLEALKVIEATNGVDSVDAGTIYSMLATNAVNRDQYSEAEDLLKRALALHEKHLGANHSNVGNDLVKFVDVYKNQGKYDEAEKAASRALKIQSAAIGPESYSTATAMTTLAGVYKDQQKFDKAIPLLKSAIEIYRQSLGAENRSAVYPMCALGEIYLAQGQSADAREIVQRAADILTNDKDSAPQVAAMVYTELAALERQEKKLPEAEEHLRKALAARQTIFGSNSVRLLGDLRLLTKVLQEQGKTAELGDINSKIASIEAAHPEVATKPVAVPQSAAKVDVAASPSGAGGVGDKWALVVGVSNFADSDLNLKYAAKDAIDFGNFLQSSAKFAPDHVKVITDKDATRDNIIKQLGAGWLGRLARPNDLVVVYVSSHGSVSRDEAGGVNFLVAHDTQANALLGTGIPMQWLSQIIKEQVHSDRVVVILDVCHSGAVSGGQKGLARDTNKFDPAKIEVGAGQAIICSSAPEQVSWESKNYANSVFTKKLIEALQQEKSSVDLNKAYAYLKEQVETEVLRDRGQMQTPLLFSKAWRGAPPVLSVVPTNPRPASVQANSN